MLQRKRLPLRGEIWFVKLPTDPPDKQPRPVIIVSTDARNRQERANTVLIVPISTSIIKDVPTHLFLASGEMGLGADGVAQAENITVIRKESLIEPRQGVRQISNTKISELAKMVAIAMGCLGD